MSSWTVAASQSLKLPLVWIDLEMTGLDVEKDCILEIACVITDGKLHLMVEGPDLIINQPDECLDKMGKWCQEKHTASGLVEEVRKSKVTQQEAEQQTRNDDFLRLRISIEGVDVASLVKESHYPFWSTVEEVVKVIEFVEEHTDPLHRPLLAGNSIYTDYYFMKKHMPKLASLFCHVLVDVSSITALSFRWYPKEAHKAPPKKKSHRALEDIKESITELKYFQKSIFRETKESSS